MPLGPALRVGVTHSENFRRTLSCAILLVANSVTQRLPSVPSAMPAGWLDAVGIGYWLVTAGGGVGDGVAVPLVIGVPLPHAARKPAARSASARRAVAQQMFSSE